MPCHNDELKSIRLLKDFEFSGIWQTMTPITKKRMWSETIFWLNAVSSLLFWLLSFLQLFLLFFCHARTHTKIKVFWKHIWFCCARVDMYFYGCCCFGAKTVKMFLYFVGGEVNLNSFWFYWKLKLVLFIKYLYFCQPCNILRILYSIW